MSREQANVNKQPMHAKCCQSDNMNDNICEINVALNRPEIIILNNFLSLSYSVQSNCAHFPWLSCQVVSERFQLGKKETVLRLFRFLCQTEQSRAPMQRCSSNSSFHFLSRTFRLHFKEIVNPGLLIQDLLKTELWGFQHFSLIKQGC